MARSYNKPKGVTLTELLIVVIIIAVLGALALPMLNKTIEKARVEEAKSNLNLMRMAEKSYFLANSTYTATIADLNIEDPNSVSSYFTYTIPSANASDFTARAQRKSGAYSSYYYEISKSGAITSNGSPLL